MCSMIRTAWLMVALLITGVLWPGCIKSPTFPSDDLFVQLETLPSGNPAEDAVPLSPSDGGPEGGAYSGRILVDASRDGGVWWFPQSPPAFSPDLDHQGKGLADYLRSLGFEVDELPREVTITDDLLNKYTRVIRAGDFGAYTEAELQAYERYLARGTALLLISEFHRGEGRDQLAERLGISLTGWVNGEVSQFADHSVTQSVTPFPYIAGSVVANAASNPAIQILGRLSTGEPVMGILNHPTAKIFFLGELNGIEGVPQPFVDNLIAWAFQ